MFKLSARLKIILNLMFKIKESPAKLSKRDTITVPRTFFLLFKVDDGQQSVYKTLFYKNSFSNSTLKSLNHYPKKGKI